MFRLTVIYDNKAGHDFTGSWGFAVLVETNSETLLFDTGWDGTLLLKHMKKLNINPMYRKTYSFSPSLGPHRRPS